MEMMRMLKITVPSTEYWDETKEEFVNIGKELCN